MSITGLGYAISAIDSRKQALSPGQANEVVELARSGMPKADIARSYGISRETLYTYIWGS